MNYILFGNFYYPLFSLNDSLRLFLTAPFVRRLSY